MADVSWYFLFIFIIWDVTNHFMTLKMSPPIYQSLNKWYCTDACLKISCCWIFGIASTFHPWRLKLQISCKQDACGKCNKICASVHLWFGNSFSENCILHSQHKCVHGLEKRKNPHEIVSWEKNSRDSFHSQMETKKIFSKRISHEIRFLTRTKF